MATRVLRAMFCVVVAEHVRAREGVSIVNGAGGSCSRSWSRCSELTFSQVRSETMIGDWHGTRAPREFLARTARDARLFRAQQDAAINQKLQMGQPSEHRRRPASAKPAQPSLASPRSTALPASSGQRTTPATVLSVVTSRHLQIAQRVLQDEASPVRLQAHSQITNEERIRQLTQSLSALGQNEQLPERAAASDLVGVISLLLQAASTVAEEAAAESAVAKRGSARRVTCPPHLGPA